MDKKVTNKPATIKCALCPEMVKPEDYPAHIAAKHQPQPPIAAAAYQGPPSTGWSLPQNAGLQASIMPPPPRVPFINAPFLNERGGSVNAIITGVRPSSGGRAEFGPPRAGYFIDLNVEGCGAMVGRINIGDSRHIILWEKFQEKCLNQRVKIRIPTAADKTKAHWVFE